MRRTTVLVVDERSGGRARRRAMLEAGGLEVCGETSSASAAIEIAERQTPDICLIDAHVAGALEATEAIAARTPASRVVIVGGAANGQAMKALAAGAAGYVVGRDPARLPEVLERVRDGEVAIPRALAAALAADYRRRSARARLADRLAARGVRLTPQEWRVLHLLSEDRTTAEIADELGISPVTVRSHAASIVRKLGVSDREEARRVLLDAAAV